MSEANAGTCCLFYTQRALRRSRQDADLIPPWQGALSGDEDGRDQLAMLRTQGTKRQQTKRQERKISRKMLRRNCAWREKSHVRKSRQGALAQNTVGMAMASIHGDIHNNQNLLDCSHDSYAAFGSILTGRGGVRLSTI